MVLEVDVSSVSALQPGPGTHPRSMVEFGARWETKQCGTFHDDHADLHFFFISVISKLQGEVSSNIPHHALHYTVSMCVCDSTGAGMRNLLYSLTDTPVLLS